MRKTLYSILGLVISMQVLAWTSPVPIPDVGQVRLRIVGQNAQNYLLNFDASNASCTTQAAFDAKTDKMANVFLALEADIVAMCEVEENDSVLGCIAAAMNRLYGQNVYTFIKDGMYVHADEGAYQQIKAGFIYRKDKVEPQGTSTSPYTKFPYKARLRIQAFKEKSTGEIFTLSMNHFKAKDSSEDAGDATRMENVSTLLSKLSKITSDPDILIMGDLNAYSEEPPLEALYDAGYREQLIRFDPNAYTYIYKKQKGILDHVLANAPMEEQVLGAYAYHINTSGSYSYTYSDHDAVVVGINLGEEENPEGIEDTQDGQPKARKILRNGQLMIEINGELYTLTGIQIKQ